MIVLLEGAEPMAQGKLVLASDLPGSQSLGDLVGDRKALQLRLCHVIGFTSARQNSRSICAKVTPSLACFIASAMKLDGR